MEDNTRAFLQNSTFGRNVERPLPTTLARAVKLLQHKLTRKVSLAKSPQNVLKLLRSFPHMRGNRPISHNV